MRVRARLPLDLQLLGGSIQNLSEQHPLSTHLIDNHPDIEQIDHFTIVTVSDSYENTISSSLAEFLIEDGVCFKCFSKIENIRTPCLCNFPNLLNRSDTLNLILVLGDWRGSKFFDLKTRSYNGAKSKRKQQRDGYIPLKLSDQIYSAQQGKCYYCAKQTDRGKSGPNQAQLDHYDSDGGSKIDNLVIACKHCNTKKARTHGSFFARSINVDLTSDEKKY